LVDKISNVLQMPVISSELGQSHNKSIQVNG